MKARTQYRLNPKNQYRLAAVLLTLGIVLILARLILLLVIHLEEGFWIGLIVAALITVTGAIHVREARKRINREAALAEEHQGPS